MEAPAPPTRALALAVLLAAPAVVLGQDWNRFRGPGGQGRSGEGLPTTFTDDNVLWRVPSGTGHSSPVLAGDRIFLTRLAAAPGRREIVSLDVATGVEKWAHGCAFESHPEHVLNNPASSTPAVDDRGVYVVWATGSELEALAVDHDGRELWRRRLGPFVAQHGDGASPIVWRDLVVVANEHEGGGDGSCLLALDKATGETRWRIPRKSTQQRATYATPVVYRPNGGDEYLLFASSAHGVTAVDPVEGEILWEVDAGFKARCVATPAITGEWLFQAAGTGASGREAIVVRLPHDGVAEPELAYRPRRSLPYVPCALGLAGRFYLFQDGGIATCLEATTGKVVWRERLEAQFFSSPVSDGATVFIADRDGTLWTLAAGERFEVLGRFELGAPVFATPAIRGRKLFVRTSDSLICLGPARSPK